MATHTQKKGSENYTGTSKVNTDGVCPTPLLKHTPSPDVNFCPPALESGHEQRVGVTCSSCYVGSPLLWKELSQVLFFLYCFHWCVPWLSRFTVFYPRFWNPKHRWKRRRCSVTALVTTADLNGGDAIYSPSLASPNVGSQATDCRILKTLNCGQLPKPCWGHYKMRCICYVFPF